MSVVRSEALAVVRADDGVRCDLVDDREFPAHDLDDIHLLHRLVIPATDSLLTLWGRHSIVRIASRTLSVSVEPAFCTASL